MMQKIVIFDMDGTLIDSKKDITISVNHVRHVNHNLLPLSEDFIVHAINMHQRNLPKLFYETEVYEERDRVLYDGVKELLFTLKENGIKMSVATNAPTLFAQMMLEHLQVAELFDLIVGADKVKASKPNPDMLHYILDFYAFEREKDKAWMIGDNSKDIESAQNAKIDALFAAWGFSASGTHDIVVKHPKEIISIVL